MARVTLDRITLTDSKTGHMDLKIRERRQAGEKSPELTELIHSKSVRLPVDLESDRWYTLRIDVEGDVMRASVDGKSIGQFKSEGIAHPTKRMITLAVNKSAWIDELKVWRKK
jgi:hypothetical protein